ncbi:hypothetical protein RJ498_000893 [Pluralibacter gergoviae]
MFGNAGAMSICDIPETAASSASTGRMRASLSGICHPMTGAIMRLYRVA